ncbi:MAG TPA: DUF3499 domain-containing protein [Marmoricola sp.]|nr:DUF3499 domain-containing protein [Marmoricola sp.]HNJ78405.1 DUF3499 domain-containing protein [Marmoricola sp.]HNN47655.1 DUF3499 domain-containing protein [Marmoricola sp.]
MAIQRRCSRAACDAQATTTLTFVYADQTAVVGPLATYAEPHAYDLCEQHAQRLSAPQGWEVIRLAHDVDPQPSADELVALADAVREVAVPPVVATGSTAEIPQMSPANVVQKGHLRSVPTGP